MPPQHQKSTMLTEYLPAWAFGQNINYQCLLVMYNSTQAKKQNRKIQRVIQSEKYKRIFPKTKLNEKNVVTASKESYIKNSEEFEIVGGRGFLKSVGVEGGIAGNPAGLAFMDDVIKNVAEANSQTYRNKVFDWYTDELEARLHNNSKVAFTITRRHEDDLAGRLILRDGTTETGGKWKVLKLPALKEDNGNKDDPREIGQALFPQLHSRQRLEEIKQKQPRTFAGLYQQRPAAKGGDMIKGEWFEIIEENRLPFNINYVTWSCFIDGAWTEKKQNDETAMCFCYFDKAAKVLYIRNITGVRKKLSDFIAFFSGFARLNGLTNESLIQIELKASGYAFEDLLLKSGWNCTGINNNFVRLGKFNRVESIEPFLRSGRVKLIKGAWIDSFIQQAEGFPNAKHDDKIDVLCYPIFEYLIEGSNPYITL